MTAMLHAVNLALSNYATFSGRASRPALWWWVLAVFIVLLITRLIDGAVISPLLGFQAFGADGGQPLSFIVSVALILPNLAVGARRLHDIGRSGWWLLIGLIPLIGTLVLIYFYIQPGDTKENEFGVPEPFNPAS